MPPSVPNAGNRGTAAFQIRIPSGSSTSAQGRVSPQYVSSGTQSIGVVETDQGASPSPAVFVNVSTCPQQQGITTCSVSVPANPGTDTFAISAYSAPNGGGSVLSSGSIVATIVAGVANTTTTVTLNGVVATIVITAAAPTLALGESTTLNVVAKDASGATIVGTFDHPITLSGNNLAFSSTSLASSTAASSVTIAWNYGFAGSSASTISGTADGATGTLSLAPGTGIAYYQAGTNPATDTTNFKMIAGPDGNLYFTSLGPLVCTNEICIATNGAVHQFNPTTGTDAQVGLNSEGIGLFFTSDGALWIAGGAQNQVFRMAPGSFSASALQTIALPTPTTTHVNVRAFAQDSSGNLWVVDGPGHRLLKIPVAGPYATASFTTYTLPNGPTGTPGYGPSGFGIAYASDGNLYVMDRNNGVLDQVNPATGATTKQLLTPQQVTIGTSDSAGLYDMGGGGATLYVASAGQFSAFYPNGFLDSFNVGQQSYTVVGLPSTFATEIEAPSVNGTTLYYGDLYWGIGSVNLTTGSARMFPVEVNGVATSLTPNGVAAMSDGTAWFTCYGSSAFPTFQPGCVGHTIYLSGWSIFPSRSFALFGTGTESEQLVGIMESPSSNSGPFTAVSSTTSVCTATSVSDHNFNVVGVGAGACLITVTDAHGVSESINVTVTSTSGTVQTVRKKSAGGIL